MAEKSRGLYNKPSRTQAMIEIRRRIVAGNTYHQIMNDLHIPERTFFRYLALLSEQDCKRLAKDDDAEAKLQFTILRDRLINQYKATNELANNERLDGMARVKARQLACELAVAIHKLYAVGPTNKTEEWRSLLRSSASLLPRQPKSQQEQLYWNPVLKIWDTLPPPPYATDNTTSLEQTSEVQ